MTIHRKLSESGKQDSEVGVIVLLFLQFSLPACLSLQPQSPPVPDERLEEISKQLDLVTQER